MNVSQENLELLEGKLDGALSQAEEAELAARLSGEPELAQALEALRGERAMRAEYFAALEPAEGEASWLAERICAAAAAANAARRRRSELRWHLGLRWGSAVAACLLIGFIGGWIGRQHMHGVASGPVVSPGADVKTVVSYQVLLRDNSGQVVATQNFDTLEKAQAFERDVQSWQQQSEQLLKGPLPIAEAQL